MPRKNSFETYLRKIQKFYNQEKYIPNFEVTAGILGVKSKRSVHLFFQTLIKENYLKKEGYTFIPLPRFLVTYLYSSIRAGFSTPADEVSRKSIELERYIMEHPNSSLLITVKGDSMIDAGIFEGDIVIVDKALHNPQRGDIIVACIDGHYTLKYFERDDKGNVFLRAGNKTYKDFFPQESLEIFGTVVSVIRKLR